MQLIHRWSKVLILFITADLGPILIIPIVFYTCEYVYNVISICCIFCYDFSENIPFYFLTHNSLRCNFECNFVLCYSSCSAFIFIRLSRSEMFVIKSHSYIIYWQIILVYYLDCFDHIESLRSTAVMSRFPYILHFFHYCARICNCKLSPRILYSV